MRPVEEALQLTSETDDVDFKSHFDPASTEEWLEVLKDIVAIANSGGGYLIFGVADNGVPLIGQSPVLAATDPAQVGDKVYKFTGVHFNGIRIEMLVKAGQQVSVLRIEGAPTPIVFTKNGNYESAGKQKNAFNPGVAYFRHGAKSEPGCTEDLRKSFERLWQTRIPKGFESDSLAVVKLVQERPDYWQVLLVVELLEEATRSGRRRMHELTSGLVHRRNEYISEEEVPLRTERFFGDLTNFVEALNPALEAIPLAAGPSAPPGDPIEIRTACARIASIIESLVEWETDLRFVSAPEKFRPLFASLQGSTNEVIEELERAPREIRELLEFARSRPGTHRKAINLVLKAPASFERYHKEVRKLTRGFRLW